MPEDQNCRRSRSCSPGPSRRPRRDYVAASSAASTASRAVHSRPSPRSGVLDWRVNATANTPLPSTPGRLVDPPNFTGQHSTVSRRFSVGESNLAYMAAGPSPVAQHSTYLPYIPNCPDPTQIQQSLHKNAGMFNQARDFTVMGTFVDGNVTYNDARSNQFMIMEKLLGETIRGAEFDSSDRDPPPRCQPGTRLAVLERCILFISNCDGVQKMRWVVGAAGVGKSAIMQSVAESPDLPVGSPASVFFSVNGRNDGTKAIKTLSYQLAARIATYRQVIERAITCDPSLLQSSMSKQFKKLIIDPFIHNPQLKYSGRVVIIIDGLDECKDDHAQLELLRLISDLCLTYPSSPLVWLIASRPEPHITSFFSGRNILAAYEKEEIPVNSDEACADVERFLCVKFTEIKEGSDSLDPRWPNEQDFWKVADAAGGLFAYAQTVIRYIGDSRIGSPVSQLSDVLDVIDQHLTAGWSREEHPMALLDALYERILSKVPPKIMTNTRKLLLILASSGGILVSDKHPTPPTFVVLCNWLGMTADEGYAALHHLRSVFRVPRRDEAHKKLVEAFHKSFFDYLFDHTRSRFSPDFLEELRQLATESALRILNEVPNGIRLYGPEVYFSSGEVASGSSTRDKISLTWLIEDAGGDDNDTRLRLYYRAIHEVRRGVRRKDPIFQSNLCICFLTAGWVSYPIGFPYDELMNMVFDDTRRLEFMTCGILKEIPLLDAATVRILHPFHPVKFEFRYPATTGAHSLDPLYSFYCHERTDGPGGTVDGWMRLFWGSSTISPNNTPGIHCVFCLERLKDQLKNWTTDSPDDTALIMFTATGECCIQVRLVDPEDGMSEWTYTFWAYIPLDKRRKYGSAAEFPAYT